MDINFQLTIFFLVKNHMVGFCKKLQFQNKQIFIQIFFENSRA